MLAQSQSCLLPHTRSFQHKQGRAACPARRCAGHSRALASARAQGEEFPAASTTDKVLEAVALEAGLADLARQALSSDPEAAAQLKRYEAAVVRLEKAKAAEKELEDIMKDALAAAAEQDAAAAATARQRADQLLAEAEVAAAERMLEAAELEFNSAKRQQTMLQQELGQDSEREESGKAAAVAAAGGLAGYLPFFLLTSGSSGLQSLLSLAAAVAGCVLFGVTYRYAVRQDVDNLQLRGGAVAAFALVKALGASDVVQASAESGDVLSVSVLGTCALYAAQSMLVFGFAAAALEAAFSNALVRRMGGSAR